MKRSKYVRYGTITIAEAEARTVIGVKEEDPATTMVTKTFDERVIGVVRIMKLKDGYHNYNVDYENGEIRQLGYYLSKEVAVELATKHLKSTHSWGEI
jgi:hypothetical protein